MSETFHKNKKVKQTFQVPFLEPISIPGVAHFSTVLHSKTSQRMAPLSSHPPPLASILSSTCLNLASVFTVPLKLLLLWSMTHMLLNPTIHVVLSLILPSLSSISTVDPFLLETLGTLKLVQLSSSLPHCSFSVCLALSPRLNIETLGTLHPLFFLSPLFLHSLGDLIRLGFKHHGYNPFHKQNDSHFCVSSLDLSLEFHRECPTWNSTFPLGYLIDISI